MSLNKLETPPSEVNLVHRVVDGDHTFTCSDIPGLYIFGQDKDATLTRAVAALSVHATRTFGIKLEYILEPNDADVSTFPFGLPLHLKPIQLSNSI